MVCMEQRQSYVSPVWQADRRRTDEKQAGLRAAREASRWAKDSPWTPESSASGGQWGHELKYLSVQLPLVALPLVLLSAPKTQTGIEKKALYIT